jgi:murein DD-endopeptidase MepM/ murein hydrolase activator NlpD
MGIDFSASTGTRVYAPYDGTVFTLGRMGCVGNALVLEHEVTDGQKPLTVYSVYYHLQGFNQMVQDKSGKVRPRLDRNEKLKAGERIVPFKVGMKVSKDSLIAFTGSTGTKVDFSAKVKRGCVDGPHLHFELKRPLTAEDVDTLEKAFAKNTAMRFSSFVGQTAHINPAEYVPYIDEMCYRRRKVELKNAVLLEKSQGIKFLPIMTAGPCSVDTERKLRLEIEDELKDQLKNPVQLVYGKNLPRLYRLKTSDDIIPYYQDLILGNTEDTQTPLIQQVKPQPKAQQANTEAPKNNIKIKRN